jgi:1,2-diacylglycerol-3-alpha-glucose alpha-1,2-galactosyltransferase
MVFGGIVGPSAAGAASDRLWRSMLTMNPEGAKPLVVNLVSETVDGSKGHGVHTAFLQTRIALERAGAEVRVNAGPGSDVVHIETMGLRSLRLLLRTRERAVVTAHVVPESMVGSFMLAPLWLPIGAWYMRAFYSLADEVLAVSPEVVDGLERMGLDVPVRFVPNAIDVDHFRPQDGWREQVRAELGIDRDAFVAVCAGQVQPRKGVKAFVDAARAMPDVTFVWAGGMPFRRLTAHYREMLRLVAEAPANCKFLGDLPYEDMPRLYAGADCLLFPSLQETFGLAIIEAAAAGLPLVLRDLPTYQPLFGDAYLAGDEQTFVERVTAIRDEPTLRALYAKRARDMASRFDTVRHGQLLLAAYDDVLARAEAERARTARRVRPVLQWAFSERSHRR